MKYRIDETEVFDSAEDAAKYLADQIGVDEEAYDQMLDDVHGMCEIAGMEYSTSYCLKEIDPVAYRCGFSDWSSEQLDEMREEYERKLDRMWDGDDEWFENCFVEAFEEDEESEEDDDE